MREVAKDDKVSIQALKMRSAGPAINQYGDQPDVQSLQSQARAIEEQKQQTQSFTNAFGNTMQ